MKRLPVLLAAIVAIGVGTILLLSAPKKPATGPVVLAASSLQEALEDAADRWAAMGHPRPVLSFAASSALARQVEAGAPADLFLSADGKWMDDVAARGLVRSGSRRDFLGNRLVLVAPAASKLDLPIARGFPLAAALGGGKLAMGDPEAVPAGKYAKAALTSLGVWPQVAGKVAYGDNVRAVLALVERGEVPLGVVYATDAKASGKVRMIGTFPASSHPPIVYPLAVLAASTNGDAEPFRRFLLSAESQPLFAQRGFAVP